MDYTALLTKAINDLFTPETPVVLSDPNQKLSALYVEDPEDAVEIGIEVENLLIDFHQTTPPDLDKVFNPDMTVAEAIQALEHVLNPNAPSV